jgi:hypothetical protein
MSPVDEQSSVVMAGWRASNWRLLIGHCSPLSIPAGQLSWHWQSWQEKHRKAGRSFSSFSLRFPREKYHLPQSSDNKQHHHPQPAVASQEQPLQALALLW